MRLAEKILRKHARIASGALHIGKGIKGTSRHAALHPFQGIEPVNDNLPALLKTSTKTLDLVHWPGHGGKARHLGGYIDAGMIDSDELSHMFDERLRPDAKPQSPAGHGESLRPAVENDGALPQF